MEKKLCRNEHDKVIGGVSSGLADYLQIDVTIVRLLFILSTIFILGSGLLAYLILWIVLPVNHNPLQRYAKFQDSFGQMKPDERQTFGEPDASERQASPEEATKWNTPNSGAGFNNFGQQDFFQKPKGNDTSRTVVGLVLLVLGIYFLLKKFFFFPVWFSFYKLWPLVIVAIGISLIFRNRQRNEWEEFKRRTEEAEKNTGADK